ncbi:hypothetical protein FQZ97_1150210 [compost metagenome]
MRPSAAPGRKSDWTTRRRNITINSGSRTAFAREMPLRIPATMMAMTAAHISSSGKNTEGTNSKPRPGASATARKFPKKKPSASSPQASVKEKIMYISDQAMITA